MRNIEKAKKVLPEQVEIVVGDLTNVESLTSALKDTEYLFLNLSTMSGPGEEFYTEFHGVKNVLEAAKNHDIKQILQISGLLAHKPEFQKNGEELFPNTIRNKGMDLIRASGIPYTFLHCTWFLNSLFMMLKGDTFATLGTFNAPLYWTNTTDFADQLTSAIANEKAFSKDYAIQGKEQFNFDDAAKRFVNILNPNINIIRIPLQPEMGFLYGFIRVFEAYEETFVGQSAWDDLGEPKETLESFISSLIQK